MSCNALKVSDRMMRPGPRCEGNFLLGDFLFGDGVAVDIKPMQKLFGFRNIFAREGSRDCLYYVERMIILHFFIPFDPRPNSSGYL